MIVFDLFYLYSKGFYNVVNQPIEFVFFLSFLHNH